MAFSLFIGIVVVCHAQIDNPGTMEVSRVEAYQNYVETGDQLYLVSFEATYTPCNTAPAGYNVEDIFLFRLMNGGTQIAVNTAYPYNGDGTDYCAGGFDVGVMSVYFSASDVTNLGMGWGAATNYYVQFTGNPIFAWTAGTPPQVNHSVDSWFDDDVPDRFSARIRYIASQVEVDWGDDLIDGPSGQQTLTNDGEEYFTNSIPNLKVVCPDIFGATYIEAGFEDSEYISDGWAGGDTTDRLIYGANWAAQSFTATADYTINRVEVKLRNVVGTPSAISVGIYPYGNGSPNIASLLCNGTITGVLDTFRQGVWYECSLGDGADLTALSEYAIVLSSPTSDVNNYAGWRRQDPGTYPDGTGLRSVDSGVNWLVGVYDFMFITKAEDAYSGAEAMKREDRLIGGPFDMTAMATQWGMTRMQLSTTVYLILSLCFAIACARWAGTYSIVFFLLALLQPIGWYAGFVAPTFAWMVVVCCGLLVIFQLTWRAT